MDTLKEKTIMIIKDVWVAIPKKLEAISGDVPILISELRLPMPKNKILFRAWQGLTMNELWADALISEGYAVECIKSGPSWDEDFSASHEPGFHITINPIR